MLADRYGCRRGSGAGGPRRRSPRRTRSTLVALHRLIKEAVPYEERAGSLRRCGGGRGGDDAINADEHGLMRLVASLLGVADQGSALARQRALRDR